MSPPTDRRRIATAIAETILKTGARLTGAEPATRARDTLRWLLPDLCFRLLPFTAVIGAVWLLWRPRWLGLSVGDLRAQLTFGLAGLVGFFVLAALLQVFLTGRRGRLAIPSSGDALLQAGYYLLNGPLEEGFFRGLLQGGLTVVMGPLGGFGAATIAYVLYHRLGRWWWPDVVATALLGVPLGLAYWLLPGPPSLLGVTLAHIGATCGFLGPGPYLLRRLRLV